MRRMICKNHNSLNLTHLFALYMQNDVYKSQEVDMLPYSVFATVP